MNQIATNLELRKRSRQGIYIMIGSLGIFFFASMLLYLGYIQFRLGIAPTAAQQFVVPRSFWLSTLLLIAISGLLHFAITAARKDRFVSIIIRTNLAMAAAIAFLFIQSDAMSTLLQETKNYSNVSISPYPYTVILAVLHALHVVAGMGSLGFVCVKSWLSRYDHERCFGLEICAIYWHFLDVVWLIMLASFYVAAWIFNSV